MLEDKSPAVTLNAMKLSSHLAFLDRLTDDEIDNVYGLVSDQDPKLRRASGEFINAYFLEQVVLEESRQRALRKRISKDSFVDYFTKDKISALVAFIQNKTSHPDFPDYCVSALWEYCPSLQSWEIMINMLLEPPVEFSPIGLSNSS